MKSMNLTAIITSVGTLITLLAVVLGFSFEYGPDIVKFHKLMALNPDSIEHVMGDVHDVLHTNSQLERKLELERTRNVAQGKYYRARIDSAFLYIDILRAGKHPYGDSIWVKDRFGQWIRTTVTEEFKFRR